MKHNTPFIKRLALAFVLLCNVWTYLLQAQIGPSPTYPKVSKVTFSYNEGGTSKSLYVREFTGARTPELKIKKALLYVEQDWNTAYFPIADNTYEAQITINGYSTYSGTEGLKSTYQKSLTIDKNKTKAYQIVADFSDVYESINRFDVSVSYIRTNASNTDNATTAIIENALKTQVYYTEEFQYNYNAVYDDLTVTPVSVTKKATGNELNFKWSTSSFFTAPNYEFQLLRLYNVDPSKTISEGNISTILDWSKALTIETGNAEKELNLTLAEGTGFYVWRVRPIGNAYEGGIANNLNWGPWSLTTGYPEESSVVPTSIIPNPSVAVQSAGAPFVFFYNQFDNDKNWIFNRSFVEGDKLTNGQVNIGEGISYANGLEMVQQQQTRLKAQDKKMVQQTIYDYSGRPAITTLPAIEEESTLGYISSYAKDVVDENLYTADDFDAGNYRSPRGFSTTSGPGKYYSENNTIESNVPSAEGVPYSRTLYTIDGTSKIKEQSAPGATHKMGSTHTTRNLVGSVSDDELIKLFGDEAPAASSVLKTITTDANGTASISYISKEGKTIATCLSTPGATNLDAISDPPILTTSFDIDNNTPYGENGLRASKNIVVAKATNLLINYSISPQAYDLAVDCLPGFCSTCDYKITVKVIDNDDPATPVANGTHSIVIHPADNCTPEDRGLNNITVPVNNPGSYTVERIIETNTSANASVPTYLQEQISQLQHDFFARFNNVENDDNTSLPATAVVTAKVIDVQNGEETVVNTVSNLLMVQINTMLDAASTQSIADLYDYLDVDPAYIVANTSKYVLLEFDNCTKIKLPIIACADDFPAPDNNGKYDFEVLYVEWKSAILGGKGNTPVITDLFPSLSAGEFNTIINNMIAYGHGVGESAKWRYDKYKLLENFKGLFGSKANGNVTTSLQSNSNNSPNISSINAPAIDVTKIDYLDRFISAAEYDMTDPGAGDKPTTGYQIIATSSTANQYKLQPFLYVEYPLNGTTRCETCEKIFYAQYHPGTTISSNPYSDATAFANDFAAAASSVSVSINGNATTAFPKSDFANCIKSSCGSNSSINVTSPSTSAEAATAVAALMAEQIANCKSSCDDRFDTFKTSIIDMYHKNGTEVQGDQYQLTLNEDNVYVFGNTLLPEEEYIVPSQVVVCQTTNADYTCKNKCVLSLDNRVTINLDKLKAMQDVMYGSFEFKTSDVYGDCQNQYAALDVMPSAIDDVNWIMDLLNEGLAEQKAIAQEALSNQNPDDNAYYKDGFYWDFRNYLQTFGFFFGPFTGIGDHVFVHPTIPSGFDYADVRNGSTANVDRLYYYFNQHAAGGSSEPIVYVYPPCDALTPLVPSNNNFIASGYGLISYPNEPYDGVLVIDANFNPFVNNSASSLGSINSACLGTTLPPVYHYGQAYWQSDAMYFNMLNQCAPLCYKINPPPVLNINDPNIADEIITITPKSCAEQTALQLKEQMNVQLTAVLNKQIEDLKNVYRKKCIDELNDHLTVSFGVNYHHYTLYYYDRAGNLVKTVPPEGVKLTSNTRNDHPAHTLVTEYAYNSLGQLIRQKTPDGGETRFFYDTKARLRFSQNAKQAMTNKMSYTKYDEIGRIVEVGQVTQQNDPTTAQLDNLDYPAKGTGYEITVTEYSVNKGVVYALGSNKPQRYLQNRVSCTYTDRDGDPTGTADKVTTYYSYDPHGNVEWIVQDIPELGTKSIGYEYDLISGSVVKVKYNEGRPDQFYHRYTYDIDKRIKTVETSKDQILWEKDAAYTYYLHGPLKRAVIGNDQLQGLDYVYTVQGWLKGINHINAANDPGMDGNLTQGSVPKDAYSMLLNYYDGDFANTNSPYSSSSTYHLSAPAIGSNSRELFNGNISSWTNNYDYTAMASAMVNNYNNAPVGRTFKYDELNRITDATFNVHNGTTWDAKNDYHESFTYDANGNILTAQRNGFEDIDSQNPTGLEMDNLNYEYQPNTNRLSYVVDNPLLTNNYTTDIDQQTPDNYVYDAIGNLVVDHKEKIEGIEWNVYGKIRSIAKEDGTVIEFLYDASGKRVYKKVYKTTDPDPIATAQTSYYVCDASGNAMAIYERNNTIDGSINGNTNYKASFKLKEQAIYGSDRLGLKQADPDLLPVKIGYFTVNTGPDELVVANDDVVVNTNDNLLPSACTTANLSTDAGDIDMVATDGEVNTENSTCSVNTGSAIISGKAGNNTAVYEGSCGEKILKSISMRQYNNTDDVTLVSNNKGEYFNTVGLKNYSGGKSLFMKKPGTENEYFYFTIGGDRKAYYHIFNTSNPLLRVSKNNLLDNDVDYSYTYSMALIEDKTGTHNSMLYMKRIQTGGVIAELVSFEIDQTGAISGPFVEDQFLSGERFVGFSELQVSADGTELSVANNIGIINILGIYSEGGELRRYKLDENYIPEVTDDETPTFAYGAHTAAKSFDYNNQNTGILYSKNSLSASNVYSLALTETSMTASNAFNASNTKGDIRRGSNGNIYIANAYTSTTNNIVEVNTETTSWTSTAYAAENKLSGSLALNSHILDVEANTVCTEEPALYRNLGYKEYELKDHLGNVRAVINDKKIAHVANGAIDYYKTSILQATDYYAFGAIMPGRSYTSSTGYRYGFNGKEKDDEIKGAGNSLDFGARIYDPRIGRMLSVDALYNLNPDKNPYNFASNSPLFMIDPDGNWDIEVHAYSDRTKYGYGIAIVKDNAGNEIYRMNVRLQGAAGSNRSVTNSDTPTGTYDITGWKNYSGTNRTSYGPNDLIVMTPESGQISETGRSGIWMHGGRQETQDSRGNWSANDNPELKKTHGCVRCYDDDLAALKVVTDALEASNPDEKPNQTTIVDDLVLRNGNYFVPSDVKQYETNVQKGTQGNLTSGLINAQSKEDFKKALDASVQQDAGTVNGEQINLQDKKVNEPN